MEHQNNWVSNTRPIVSRGALSRTQSHLLRGPELLRRTQIPKYSPRAEAHEPKPFTRNISMPHSTYESDIGHIAPDWYHLALIKMESKENSLAPTPSPLTHRSSVAENEVEDVCFMIQNARRLRKKYLYQNTKQKGHIGSIIHDDDVSLEVDRMQHILPQSQQHIYCYQFIDGIAKIYKDEDNKDHEIYKTHSFDEYIQDLEYIYKLMAFGPAKTLCYKRLKILQCRFKLHLLLNNEVEATESHSVPYRDFYNVRKVDNHIHHSACMHQKHLLRFIKDKYIKEPNKIVNKDNKTLKHVFDELNINVEYLSVDKLDVHAQQATFQRFDKFNAKYNPFGSQPLRTLFLKIDNEIKGEFLAGITKEVFNDLEKQKYQFCEYRLSIYGKKKSEWDIVSDWICNYELHSSQVRWLIQIPRIYHIFKKSNLLHNFHDMLSNIFEPLFEVSINPSSHPSLHLFLELVVGFDSVDDESLPESMRNRKHPTPSNYDSDSNPPYIYYMYYLWINIYKLNKLREDRGFNTFAFRPHSGEAGSLNHLASTFLLAHSINHGIRLRYCPILQYLYYVEQIGLSVAPLSNNILFEEYDKNPFPLFFERGLNVTLSCDDPLLIHYTKDALLEEYSIAAQVYNLSAIDLSEIARNSVLQCGWDQQSKEEWIGKDYKRKEGAAANDIYRTNVPNSRIQFRYLMLKEELTFIKSKGKNVLSKSGFFNKDKGNITDAFENEFRFSSASDEEEEEEERNKKKKLKKVNNFDQQIPILRPMQSRRSFDTEEEDESKEDEEEQQQIKTTDIDRMYSISNNIHCRIDGLLQMIDALNMNELDLKDKYNKTIYKPVYNEIIDCFKRFVRTPFGDGYVLSETNGYYLVETEIMNVSIDKGSCIIIDKCKGSFVLTNLGNGFIVDSNDVCYIIEMDNMMASIHKSHCKVMDTHHQHHHKEDIMLRDINDGDLNRIYSLEMNSYPSDEAASIEKLYYRFIFAKQYFKVFTLNGKVIGFICGTKAKQEKLSHETMSVHDKNGKHLCIHSVVIDEKHQRNGFGSKMMKLYVKQEIASIINSSLLSIRLVCKKHLISFYRNCGFGLCGESDLEHGKDKWYEMAIDITHE